MSLRERKRKNRTFVFDCLEPRELLTGGIPGNQEILGITSESIIRAQINGTITSQVPIHGSQMAFTVKFTGSGYAAKLGGVSTKGQVRLDIVEGGRLTALNYSNGTGTLTTPVGNLSLTYNGSGREQRSGNYTLTLNGLAKGVTGLFKGASTLFTAKVRGNSYGAGFSMTFILGR